MWLKLLVVGHKSLGRTGGPAITDPDGSIAKNFRFRWVAA